ncbi:hypothetical protein ACIA74_13980 [Streptomyces sp. NPDC051658]|uniref:hypothetical protein n=1 Tax=Streptomyces sp. NPDC051658 TaxID=3365667 RepID=UPI0037919BD0
MAADELRALAEAVDRLTDTRHKTSVEMGGYSGDPQVTYKGHALRLMWQPGVDVLAGQDAVEIPEPDY